MSSKRDFAKGVKLYAKYGKDASTLKILNSGTTSYTKRKLKAALEALLQKENTTKAILTEIATAKQPIKLRVYESKSKPTRKLDERAQKLKDEVGVLYRRCIYLRHSIRHQIGAPDKMPLTMEQAFQMMENIDGRKQAIPFTLRWLTYNHAMQTGGKVMEELVVFRVKEDRRVGGFAKGKKAAKAISNSPNHRIHGTINVQQVDGSDQVRTVHSYLIFEINGRPVQLGVEKGKLANADLYGAARELVTNRKKMISIWDKLDHYEAYGVIPTDAPKVLATHTDDLTLCKVRDICLTYPAWLSKAARRLDKKEGTDKAELQQQIDTKRAELNRIKQLKDV